MMDGPQTNPMVDANSTRTHRRSAINSAVTHSISRLKNRTRNRVHTVLESTDPFFDPPSTKAAGDNHIWSRHHTSPFIDLILCVGCLRAHPRLSTCCNNACGIVYLPVAFILIASGWSLEMYQQMTAMPTFLPDWSWFQLPENVVTMIMHLTSFVLLSHSIAKGTAYRSYSLAEHAMGSNGDAKQEMLTNKVLTKWVVGIGVISLIIWSVLIALILRNKLEIDFGVVGFTFIWMSFVSTMACMCGLIEAKTQHLISNTKMIYALIENVLDEKEVDESCYFRLLITVRKTMAAVTTFSWDWQMLLIATLLLPFSFGLLFFLRFVRHLLEKVVRAEETNVNQAIGVLALNFVLLLLFVFLFLAVLRMVSQVSAANSRLKRLIDFAHCDECLRSETASRCVGELRHLLEDHGAIKICGAKITGIFVLRVIKQAVKFAGVLLTIVLAGLGGIESGIDSGSSGNLTVVGVKK